MRTDWFTDLTVPGHPRSSPATGDTENRGATRVSPASPVVPSQFEGIMAEAVTGTAWTVEDLRHALSDADRADVDAGEVDADGFRDFIRVVDERHAREAGAVPGHYIERGWCEGCGSVWLWTQEAVQACPWCLNRRDGRPVPRPAQTTGTRNE